jgi:polysaccharide deacetylase family protein (PEP-CTERM system associated)
MLNALSVDVEEYFHVEAFASQVTEESWGSRESRVERSVDQVLRLFQSHRSTATFFILGWIAKKFPGMVQAIAEAGHEIGCHGLNHRHIRRQTQGQFREDIRTARQLLTDIIQKPVLCYRAPSFSITKPSLWALDILVEEGFKIDSSIFPVRHDLYGIPDANRFPHWEIAPGGNHIFEFPPSTIRWAKNNWGVGGGGYLRFFPYGFTAWAFRRLNEREHQPAMVYFHPWELDPGQPRIPAPLRSRLRHYTNLGGMQDKIVRLLNDFQFTTISGVCSLSEAFQTGGSKSS